MIRALALPLLCLATALVAAGCGDSGSSSGDADPAALVPAGAPVYVQAAVQPQGERRDDALAAAGKLLRTDDPTGKLRSLVDDALAKDGSGLTWEKDFAPWLGEDAGVWVTNLQAPEPSYAAIVATKDAEAAKAALGRFREQDEDSAYTDRSHGDVDYAVDGEGVANGIVDDYVVIGTEDAFKRTADMTDDGAALADSDRYKDAIGDEADDSLGHFYLDLKPVIDAAVRRDPQAAAQLRQMQALFPFDKLGPISGSFDADGEGMGLETVMTGVPEGPFRDLMELHTGSEASLLADLPGDAWGALAAPQLGKSAESMLNGFAGAIGGAAVAGQVKQATGLDLSQDIFSWVGDVGGFIRGEKEAALDGALVIQATDDAKAARSFGKLMGLVAKEADVTPRPVQLGNADSAFSLAAPGSPKPVVVARGEGKVVVGFGRQAAAAALSPSSSLSDSDLYGDAKEALGDDAAPAFLLSMPAVLTLIDAMGQADPDFEEARPYLEAIGSLASGGTADGDRVESRMVATFR